MADTKKPKEAQPEALTKIRIDIAGFHFECEGRESIVLDAYERGLGAWLDIEKARSKSNG